MKTTNDLIELGAVKVDSDNLYAMPCGGGVYFFCDGDEVIYIGQSQTLRRRIVDHIYKKQSSSTYVIRYEGRIRIAHERNFIEAFNPRLNQKWKGSMVSKAGKQS